MEFKFIMEMETEEIQMLFDAMNIFMETIYQDKRKRVPYVDHTNFAKKLNYRLMPYLEKKDVRITLDLTDNES